MKMLKELAAILALIITPACSSGGDDGGGQDPSLPGRGNSGSQLTLDDQDAVKFVMQSSFGASESDLDALMAQGPEDWLYEQIQLPIASYTDRMLSKQQISEVRTRDFYRHFWERAMYADDQLRQRVMFALSQIVVVSLADPGVSRYEAEFATYVDMLQRGALGNYCDMIREVSLSPMMGLYLTHLGNRKADATSGFVPDENYAREVMQLFTIGLTDLNSDGTEQATETYTLDDVQGLAAVFTGLSWADTDFERPRVTDDNSFLPMESYTAQHEASPKTFLGRTIDLGSDAEVSVDAALDHLLAHPNVAPFISKQLIQKLVTSNPSPGYVSRVARAFEAGGYQIYDGRVVGTRRRCDMAATVAAILLDDEARGPTMDDNFGKLRSPVLRLAQLLRALRVDQEVSRSGNLPQARVLDNLQSSNVFGQNAFSSPSVFNFYRPGYVAAGSESADLGLVAPEFQLVSTPALIGYINTMEDFIDGPPLVSGEANVVDISRTQFFADTDDPAALVDRIDRVLTGGTLSADNRQRVIDAVNLIGIGANTEETDRLRRVEMALFLIVVSPEYMVQR